MTLLTPVVENKKIFCQISQNFGEIPVGDETAIATLSTILETSQSDEERLQAAKSLLQVDSSNQIAINVLFELVKNLGQSPKHPDDAHYIADRATRTLSQIDPSNQLAINALVQLIRTFGYS